MTEFTQLEATHLRDRKWAVRPVGRLGTCGFYPEPWVVVYVTASSAESAIAAAKHKGGCFEKIYRGCSRKEGSTK